MPVRSDDLDFVLSLSRMPSLAAAARSLGLSPGTVTMRLQSIERRLGSRLMDRTNRRLMLTAEGELVCAHARSVANELSSLRAALDARHGLESGTLRILASYGFGRAYVAPAVAAFRRLHPNVEIDLALSDRLGRMPNTPWDLAIHIGNLPETRLKRRVLAPNERWLVAAPGYLTAHGTPRTPSDLRSHACLTLRENDEDVTLWRFEFNSRQSQVRIIPALSTNDSEVTLQWARQGLGLIVRSEWQVAEDVAQGRLIRVMPRHKLAPAPIVALTSPHAKTPARISTFLGVLNHALKPVPWR